MMDGETEGRTNNELGKIQVPILVYVSYESREILYSASSAPRSASSAALRGPRCHAGTARGRGPQTGNRMSSEINDREGL